MFSDNMGKNWQPTKPEKKIEWSLDGFIMQLPSSDQRYKDYQALLLKIRELGNEIERLKDNLE